MSQIGEFRQECGLALVMNQLVKKLIFLNTFFEEKNCCSAPRLEFLRFGYLLKTETETIPFIMTEPQVWRDKLSFHLTMICSISGDSGQILEKIILLEWGMMHSNFIAILLQFSYFAGNALLELRQIFLRNYLVFIKYTTVPNIPSI